MGVGRGEGRGVFQVQGRSCTKTDLEVREQGLGRAKKKKKKPNMLLDPQMHEEQDIEQIRKTGREHNFGLIPLGVNNPLITYSSLIFSSRDLTLQIY